MVVVSLAVPEAVAVELAVAVAVGVSLVVNDRDGVATCDGDGAGGGGGRPFAAMVLILAPERITSKTATLRTSAMRLFVKPGSPRPNVSVVVTSHDQAGLTVAPPRRVPLTHKSVFEPATVFQVKAMCVQPPSVMTGPGTSVLADRT